MGWYGNRYERKDTEQTLTVTIGDPGADAALPVLRFPVAGRVTNAWLLPLATVAAHASNWVKVGLVNGGTADPPSGTTVIAAKVGGTAGLTAGTPVALTIDSPTFAAGEWLVLDYDENGTVAPNVAVQIDYRLDA